jgi:hypothetical protein
VAALGREEHLVAYAELVEQRGDQSLVLTHRRLAQLLAGTVGIGGVEERDPGVERGPEGVEQLVARLAAGLVEGHQAEADGADLDAADRVVADGPCMHGQTLRGGA